MKFITLALLLAAAPSSARQSYSTYSQEVDLATQKQEKPLPRRAVYIWPWVKNPGAYALKRIKRTSIADLIEEAGGLIKDERYPNIPSVYFPRTIYVKRPTAKDPNPTKSIYSCSLDWDKPGAGAADCDFVLQRGDFVGISMSGAVP